MNDKNRQARPETPGLGFSASAKRAESETAVYTIQLKGQLSPRWKHWFDGLTITPDPAQNKTILSGPVADQVALHGLLNKIRDLGLELLAVTRLTEMEK